MSGIDGVAQSVLRDRVIDSREAGRLLRSAHNDPAQLAAALQRTEGLDAPTAARWASQIEIAAHAGATFDVASAALVDPHTRGQLVTRPLDTGHERIAGVFCEEFAYVGDVQQLDQQQQLTSWSQFPAFLQSLRTAQLHDPEHRHVTLALSVHGNVGTCFKLSTLGADGVEHVSVASAAWVNAQLRAAGFRPEDVTIVTEACNAGSSYQSTVDGIDAGERAQIESMAQAHRRAGATSVQTEVFDVQPGRVPPADYTWIGRGEGVNPVGTVMLQYMTGLGLPGSAAAGSRGHAGAVPGLQIRPEQRLQIFNTLPAHAVGASETQVRRTGGGVPDLIERGHEMLPSRIRTPEDARARIAARQAPATH